MFDEQINDKNRIKEWAFSVDGREWSFVSGALLMSLIIPNTQIPNALHHKLPQ